MVLFSSLTISSPASAFIFGWGKKDKAATARNVLKLRFTYGSEKKKWVKAVTKAFNAAGHEIDGKRVVIDPTPMGSQQAVNEVLDGVGKPHIISPASRVVYDYANELSSEKHGRSLFIEDEPRELVISPVVIAVWDSKAGALRANADQQASWGRMLELAEGGKLRYGHTHPQTSNSGLISIISETFAAAKLRVDNELLDAGELTVEHVKNPKVGEFVKTIESKVVHYGKSTGFFQRTMQTSGPEYITAAVMYESSVLEANEYLASQGGRERIRAIYPSEGTFFSDHPIGVVNRDWVTPAHQKAAGLYIDYLMKADTQQRAVAFGFRPGNPDVAMDFNLFSKKNGVVGKLPDNYESMSTPSFEVISAIMDLWKSNKKDSVIALVLDRSGSMKGKRWKNALIGVEALLGNLTYRDKVAFFPFNNRVRVAGVYDMNEQGRFDLMREARRNGPGGGTAYYQAIAIARKNLLEMRAADPDKIYAIIALTDGQDTASSEYPLFRGKNHREEVIRNLVKFSPQNPKDSLPVFTIGYDAPYYNLAKDKGYLGCDRNGAMKGFCLGNVIESAIAKPSRGQYQVGQSDPRKMESLFRTLALFF